jgi:hypothetical protein
VQFVVLPDSPLLLRRTVVLTLVASAVAFTACGRESPSRAEPAKIAAELKSKPNATPERVGACPAEMVLVDGQYCPKVDHVCAKWMDPPGPYSNIRCAEYKQPASCDGPREKRRYCIDRDEYVAPGDPLPMVRATWTKANETCASIGKRLCLESEWQFACEGEEMRPYPYGWRRDSSACNIDQMHLGKAEEGLNDLRRPISDDPRCVSPFGVHNMTGNVDEWAVREGLAAPYRSALRGGWWLPGRNRCRAATLGHAEYYSGPQVGFRCCKDADGESAAAPAGAATATPNAASPAPSEPPPAPPAAPPPPKDPPLPSPTPN